MSFADWQQVVMRWHTRKDISSFRLQFGMTVVSHLANRPSPRA